MSPAIVKYFLTVCVPVILAIFAMMKARSRTWLVAKLVSFAETNWSTSRHDVDHI